jgi:hypothetical protein
MFVLTRKKTNIVFQACVTHIVATRSDILILVLFVFHMKNTFLRCLNKNEGGMVIMGDLRRTLNQELYIKHWLMLVVRNRGAESGLKIKNFPNDKVFTKNFPH